jgi:hypothetical protein
MNPRNKRANSGANSPQQFTSVPRSLVKVGLVLPVGCNICDMEWTAPEREQVEGLFPALSAFRSAVTEPLAEVLHGTLIIDGGAL